MADNDSDSGDHRSPRRALTKRSRRIAIPLTMLVIAAIWYAWKVSSFSSLSESDAKWWLNASEVSILIWSSLLLAGLFGELSESESWKKHWLYKAAKFAVILGVAGELIGDGGIFAAGGRVQEIADWHATTRRLPLQSPDRVAVTHAMSIFAQGMSVKVEAYNDDHESLDFAIELWRSLRLAGVAVPQKVIRLDRDSDSIIVNGLLVVAGPDQPSQFVARKLLDVLQGLGFCAQPPGGAIPPSVRVADPGTLEVQVGYKDTLFPCK